MQNGNTVRNWEMKVRIQTVKNITVLLPFTLVLWLERPWALGLREQRRI